MKENIGWKIQTANPVKPYAGTVGKKELTTTFVHIYDIQTEGVISKDKLTISLTAFKSLM